MLVTYHDNIPFAVPHICGFAKATTATANKTNTNIVPVCISIGQDVQLKLSAASLILTHTGSSVKPIKIVVYVCGYLDCQIEYSYCSYMSYVLVLCVRRADPFYMNSIPFWDL